MQQRWTTSKHMQQRWAISKHMQQRWATSKHMQLQNIYFQDNPIIVSVIANRTIGMSLQKGHFYVIIKGTIGVCHHI